MAKRVKGVASHLSAHPRLVISTAVGAAVALLIPDVGTGVTRGLLGWNVGVWLYLMSISLMMWRADKGHLQRIACRQAEGAIAVLVVITAGAIASFVAVVIELAGAKAAGTGHTLSPLLYVVATVIGSWLLVPTLFGLSYASLYYGSKPGKGLRFPTDDAAFEPDYADFLYFSFTIAVASQTADVSISTRPMRRLTLLQSILSFAFNTTILAFSINTAASLF